MAREEERAVRKSQIVVERAVEREKRDAEKEMLKKKKKKEIVLASAMEEMMDCAMESSKSNLDVFTALSQEEDDLSARLAALSSDSPAANFSAMPSCPP